MEPSPPDDDRPNAHLSQISTAWSLVGQAHIASAPARQAAQAALFQRYRRAIYSYLLVALKDVHEADDLFQEFNLKFVRGDFRGADPERGRFRNLLRTSLGNLITNRRKQRPLCTASELLEAAAETRPAGPEVDFLEHWRKELLDRAWEALSDAQRFGGPPYHAVLRLHAEQPELSSAAVAARVSADLHLSPALTEVGMRKVLQRAREQFTDLLVEEVARSLSSGRHAELEQELRDLGFYAYCRRSLQRRLGDPAA